MSDGDWFILMGMGGLFILLGLAAFIRGKREEKSYYNSISTRYDVREFVERWPPHPQPSALKAGGWIAVSVGLALLATGIYLWVRT